MARPADRSFLRAHARPSWLVYGPALLCWAGLALRHRSLTLPTAANPGFTAGGLCGESKSAILDLVAGGERALVPPYATFDARGCPAADAGAAQAAMVRAGLAFPLVIKPDIGCNGTGVRRLEGRDDLRRYLAELRRPLPLPAIRFMLQRLVADEGEAGLFYVRQPGQARGCLTSLTLKTPPVVVGDGRSSVRVLAVEAFGARTAARLFLPHLRGTAERVPRAGERVPVLFVGNRCKGSVFADGRAAITPELTERVERFARAIPGFGFGRLDVRFPTLDDLRRGRNLSVLEVNGAGAEPTHVWDRDTRLGRACADMAGHHAAAFRIGAANRIGGARPTGVGELLRLWRLEGRLMRSYPANS